MTGFLLHLPHLRLSACHTLLYHCIFRVSQPSSAPRQPRQPLRNQEQCVKLARDSMCPCQSWGRARFSMPPQSFGSHSSNLPSASSNCPFFETFSIHRLGTRARSVHLRR
ncbi:hypothetical protein CCMA1212_008456 [Trichoderma ghanense]|uniref:Secreted protein n=1 Tax=Trichoderma ghanense TaxID=65468 RepID=A0ABY2GUM6_9HYPO